MNWVGVGVGVVFPVHCFTFNFLGNYYSFIWIDEIQQKCK